jgi:hypothetical protein
LRDVVDVHERAVLACIVGEEDRPLTFDGDSGVITEL